MLAYVVGAVAAYFGGKKIWDHYHPALQSIRATNPTTGAKVQVVVPVAKHGIPTQSPHVGTSTGLAPTTINTNQDVQKALNALGFTPALTVDGAIGPLSIANIKAFQASVPMTQDGVVSSGLKIALQNALGQTAAVKTFDAAVAQVSAAQTGINLDYLPDLQSSLNTLGASPTLALSGTLDAPTQAAIKAFQIVHGIDATGQPDEPTQTAIHSAIADLSTSFNTMADEETQDLADIQAEGAAADDAAIQGEVTIQHGDMTIKHSS